MKNKLFDFAERAGFCLWNDEPWKPKNAKIDWSNEYDNELFKFAELIVNECAEVAGCNGHVSGFELGDLIKKHFEVKHD